MYVFDFFFLVVSGFRYYIGNGTNFLVETRFNVFEYFSSC